MQGLIHISELSWNKIFTPEDVVKVGDFVRCKVIAINKEKEQIKLSLKVRIPLQPCLTSLNDSRWEQLRIYMGKSTHDANLTNWGSSR